MKRKAKPGPDKSADQIRAALLDMSTKMLRAIEGLRHALAVELEPKAKAASAPKPVAKPKGRPPMTEEQRAAAKAERDAKALAALSDPMELQRMNTEIVRMGKTLAKPQPVSRASLAAAQASVPEMGQQETFSRPTIPEPAPERPSYFTRTS